MALQKYEFMKQPIPKKVERLNKAELDKFCKSLGIDIKKKSDLLQAVYDYQRAEIDEAIESGNGFKLLKLKISYLAYEYAANLSEKIISRKKEMKADDNSHYLIYKVLGISSSEGMLIDEYQNTGRFLYKYAGSFLEEAASLCLFFANSQGSKTTLLMKHGII
jgi:hypothetical protein